MNTIKALNDQEIAQISGAINNPIAVLEGLGAPVAALIGNLLSPNALSLVVSNLAFNLNQGIQSGEAMLGQLLSGLAGIPLPSGSATGTVSAGPLSGGITI